MRLKTYWFLTIGYAAIAAGPGEKVRPEYTTTRSAP